MKITLDTNCICALEEPRADTNAAKGIVNLWKEEVLDLAVVAMSASERQADGSYLDNFENFKIRLSRIGLGEALILKPIAYWGICFSDWAVYSEEYEKVERSIHEILFPAIPFKAADFIEQEGLPQEHDLKGTKWLNAKCDVLNLWSHIYARRQIFVTSDKNFHKATKIGKLVNLGAGAILTPQDVVKRFGN